LNNNRNNRRRGRGNRNTGGGGGNQSNRIDSRARGNAPQMLDKYKKLAQDAQHHGDRVQTEYYLQFADHYLRVIADNKARQDETRSKRGDGRNDNRGGDGRDDNRNTDSRDQQQSDDDYSDDRDDRDNRRADNKRTNRRQRPRRDDDESVSAEGDVGVEGELGSPDRESGEAKPKRRARKAKVEDHDEGQSGDGPTPRRKPRASTRRKSDGEGSAEDSSGRDEEKPRKPRKRTARKSDDDAGSGEIDSAALPPAIKPEDRGNDDNLEAVR